MTSKGPGDALLTGEELGDDLGYGPARLHDEKETRDFARFLETLDVPRLRERVNYRDMLRLGIYSMPTGRGSTPNTKRSYGWKSHPTSCNLEITSLRWPRSRTAY